MQTVQGDDTRSTKETRTSRISSLLRLRSEAKEPQEVDVVRKSDHFKLIRMLDDLTREELITLKHQISRRIGE